MTHNAFGAGESAIRTPAIAHCRTYQGGAAHGMTEDGADDELDVVMGGPPSAVSGASVGSLLAMARAYGVLRSRVKAAFIEGLSNNKLLDLHPEGLPQNGLCRGEALRDMVADLVGSRTTLGESPIPIVVVATDLDTGKPRYLSRRETPHVLCIDAVVGCHFPGVFMNRAIPSLGSELSPDIRLHCDGGAVDNTTDHLWDHRRWPPRVHLSLGGVAPIKRIRPGDIMGQWLALGAAVAAVASNIKSRRADGVVVHLPRLGDGLNFAERRSVLEARYQAGRVAVRLCGDRLRRMASWSGSTTAV